MKSSLRPRSALTVGWCDRAALPQAIVPGQAARRIYPLVLKPEMARIDLWLKEIAPSDKLRPGIGDDRVRLDEISGALPLIARRQRAAGGSCLRVRAQGDAALRREGQTAQQRRGAKDLSGRKLRK
jgi:hypothetical protein